MRTVYLDSDFKCHIANDGTMTAAETSFFDDKCDVFIEGYRFVPFNEVWISEDGIEVNGEMISPFVDYDILEKAQAEYENHLKTERITALEKENAILKEENAALTECILEMSEIIYA